MTWTAVFLKTRGGWEPPFSSEIRIRCGIYDTLIL